MMTHFFMGLWMVLTLTLSASAYRPYSKNVILRVFKPEIQNFFQWKKESERTEQDLILFRDYGYFLTIQTREYLKINNETKLVMVSASPHTVIGKRLQDDPQLVSILSTGSYYNLLLFDVTDVQERNRIAALAHAAQGACGPLVPVSLDRPLTELSAPIDPIWSTSIALTNLKSYISSVQSSEILTSIQDLESLGSRFHDGSQASAAVAKVQALWQAVLPSNASIAEQSNTSAGSTQNSLVLAIPGTTDDATTIIVGAHLDSINRSNQNLAPGADDDASGIATLTEILRVIKSNNLSFQRRVEFHAYAAEEVGLIGSDVLAKSYQSAGRKIAGMLQMDMNGFPTDPTSTGTARDIYLVTNDTSAILRHQLKEVIGNYAIGTMSEQSLAAGTSDHRSWTNAGFHAVFPFESPSSYNPKIHTSQDQSTYLDSSRSAKFAQLGLAWMAHSAGLEGESSAHEAAISALKTTSSDIKVASVNGKLNGWRFALSVPTRAAYITSCKVSGTTANHCIKDPIDYVLAATRNQRNLFAGSADDASLADDQVHRITAYDNAHAVVARRDVRLRKRL